VVTNYHHYFDIYKCCQYIFKKTPVNPLYGHDYPN